MNLDAKFLRETVRVAQLSRDSGNHPFGAILVDPEDKIIISCENTFSTDRGVGHAEFNIAREAAKKFSPEFLEECTLYTSVEPCCMCSGGIYWAGIGTVVYGLAERRLATLTGDNPENLTMDLTCHRVFEAGQRKVTVKGPFPQLEEEIVETHKGFW